MGLARAAVELLICDIVPYRTVKVIIRKKEVVLLLETE